MRNHVTLFSIIAMLITSPLDANSLTAPPISGLPWGPILHGVGKVLRKKPLLALGAAGAVGEFAEKYPLMSLGIAAGAIALGTYANVNRTNEEKQKQYDYMKNFCDSGPPEKGEMCSDLSNAIDHAEKCVDLYSRWDAIYKPGDHTKKIAQWTNRVNNKKAEYDQKCTGKE